MTRPLARLGIDELEALFETSKHDLPALKRLIGELTYRNVPRAISLVVKAQKMLMFVASQREQPVPMISTLSVSQDLVGTPTPSQSGFEFDVPIFAPTELPKRPPKRASISVVALAVPVVLPTLTTAATVVPELAPIAMSTEQAYSILKVTSASHWDAIEFSRRQIVARAQPDMVAALEFGKRKALQEAAREANIAYKVLLQARS